MVFNVCHHLDYLIKCYNYLGFQVCRALHESHCWFPFVKLVLAFPVISGAFGFGISHFGWVVLCLTCTRTCLNQWRYWVLECFWNLDSTLVKLCYWRLIQLLDRWGCIVQRLMLVCCFDHHRLNWTYLGHCTSCCVTHDPSSCIYSNSQHFQFVSIIDQCFFYELYLHFWLLYLIAMHLWYCHVLFEPNLHYASSIQIFQLHTFLSSNFVCVCSLKMVRFCPFGCASSPFFLFC